MLDLEEGVDTLVQRVALPTPALSEITSGARHRRRRRTGLKAGTGIACLVAAVLIGNSLRPSASQVVVAGPLQSEQAVSGFEWFEGDGFRVQLPVGWKLEEFDITSYLDTEWTAWLPSPDVIYLPSDGSVYAPLSAQIWTSAETWWSADGWAPVGFPSSPDEYTFVDFPPIAISPHAVSGAVEGVRGEQRYLASYGSSEVEPDTFTDFNFAHGVGVAGLREDGRVTAFWLTESDLESLDGSRLDTAAIDVILDSFTLVPLPDSPRETVESELSTTAAAPESPNLEWFEGDGFRVQLPVGWKLESTEYFSYLTDVDYLAWLPPETETPSDFPPFAFAQLSADIWTSADTWESVDSWAQVRYPDISGDKLPDELSLVDFPPIAISPHAVSGAVEGVRVEQRQLSSYHGNDLGSANRPELTNFRYLHGIGVAGLRPDGRVTAIWLEEKDLKSLNESRLSQATVDAILDSFILLPLAEASQS